MAIIKPWGQFTDYYRTNEVVFKTITINPGECISFQKHENRDETWYVLEGTGQLKTSINSAESALDNYSVESLFPGFLVTIERGMWHQAINNSKDRLVIAEMQSGECSEDDIERLQDKYGRLS